MKLHGASAASTNTLQNGPGPSSWWDFFHYYNPVTVTVSSHTQISTKINFIPSANSPISNTKQYAHKKFIIENKRRKTSFRADSCVYTEPGGEDRRRMRMAPPPLLWLVVEWLMVVAAKPAQLWRRSSSFPPAFSLDRWSRLYCCRIDVQIGCVGATQLSMISGRIVLRNVYVGDEKGTIVNY